MKLELTETTAKTLLKVQEFRVPYPGAKVPSIEDLIEQAVAEYFPAAYHDACRS